MKVRDTCRHILLTGAGFTANFGGFLPSEMHQRIFNRISADPDLRTLMDHGVDFEFAYQRAMEADLSKEAKVLMNDAVFRAYSDLDDVVREWNFRTGAPYPVNIYAVRRLLHRFSGARHEAGFIFTLNQDLFVERHYADEPEPLVLPGFGKSARFRTLFPSLLDGQRIGRHEFLTAATVCDDAMHLLRRPGFSYVKLHGSYGWQASAERDLMVIGGAKGDTIGRSTLLSMYFQLFESTLLLGERRLLVIGYGFRDAHVNAAILRAIQDSGLEVFVWDRTSPAEIAARSGIDASGCAVLRRCRGYWTTPMAQMYPADQSMTARNEEFQETFFG